MRGPHPQLRDLPSPPPPSTPAYKNPAGLKRLGIAKSKSPPRYESPPFTGPPPYELVTLRIYAERRSMPHSAEAAVEAPWKGPPVGAAITYVALV